MAVDLTAQRRDHARYPDAEGYVERDGVTPSAAAVRRGPMHDFESDGPDAIAEEIGRETDYAPVEAGGAGRAASLIAELL